VAAATGEAGREVRKTVTVLFCDATASTALGERIDPESLRHLMTRYFDVMREVIEFHGGVVEKFIGDAVMAVFGVPVVHEDDALRAVRAAIGIRDRLAGLDEQIRVERGATVEWRMGINTGEVVAGDSAAGQRIVTGDAVNVASRVEAAAAPGEILIGADTQRLVRDSVTTEAIDPLTVKGKADAVLAFRLVAVSDQTGRHVRPLEAPLVGRQRPLLALNQAFREVVEERVCHLFTILGVAGVGKSRLVDEFLASLGDEATVAHGRCLSYGHGITYRPVAEAVRSAAGLTEADPPDRAQSAIADALAAEPDADRTAAIVGGLIGLERGVSAPEEAFAAVRIFFEALARKKPLVLVFDDIHWGEPTFLDLVEHLADWTRDAPILLICMARSELLESRPAWGGGKRWATTIQLEPLTGDESEELVASLLGRAELPPALGSRIAQAAEGNPLFVEELLGMLIDDGFLVREQNNWTATGDPRRLTVPPTIHALMAARLDGLGSEERTVIERAAIEGKVFHRGAVTEMTPESMRGNVRERLASLMRMELVRPDRPEFAGEEAYRFRHLLIRDAAYRALAKQARAELHERFAAWLEGAAQDRLPEFEEILAYHLEQAYRYRIELGPADTHTRELAERAGALFAAAGERAFDRGDRPATVDLLTRATDLLPLDSSRRGLLIPFLGESLYYLGEGRRADAVLTEGIENAVRAGDERAAARAAVVRLDVRGSIEATRRVEEDIFEAQRLHEVLHRIGDEAGAYRAGVSIAQHMFFVGRAAEAEAMYWRLLDQARQAGIPYGPALRYLPGSVLYGPKPVSEAIAAVEELMRLAPSSRQRALALRSLGALRAMQGKFAEARDLIDQAGKAAEELGDRIALAVADGHFRGPVEMLSGDYQRAATVMRSGYDQLTAAGDKGFASTVAAWLAEALLELGDDAEAWRFATIAQESTAPDDVTSQAHGRRVQARLLSRRGDRVAAEALAREAVGMAAQTDYLDLHGGALLDLAHVLHEAERDDEAVESARAALELFERKGIIPSAERTRQLIASWSE
jgi:class 3 adenylate cyclase/tetratricopeptide (TPR) repeat protein